jgi:RNA polymerase sigma-70 factor (ECF subfamily)
MQSEVLFDAEPFIDAPVPAGPLPPIAPRQSWLAPQERRRKPAGSVVRADLVPVLVAIGRRDMGAFERLYRLTAPSLFGVAMRIVRREATAEEVLQDAFTSVWLNAARYDPSMAAPFTWLVAIVRNRALDVLRHTRFEAEPDADEDHLERLEHVASDEPTPEDNVHTRRSALRLDRCLDRLTANQQRALALAFLEDKSHVEVALAMAVPVGTAKTWIRRGLIELRESMGVTSSVTA